MMVLMEKGESHDVLRLICGGSRVRSVVIRVSRSAYDPKVPDLCVELGRT